MRDTKSLAAGFDWEEHWKSLVAERSAAAGHDDPTYWDRRAPTFARSTRTRVEGFLDVIAPHVSSPRTLIDVGAGTGRLAVPLSEKLEWVTAVEPSEGMRALIPHRDNMTIVASTWEDAAVAPADLVICSHVMYGVQEPVEFIRKMELSARERVFVLMRETPMVHPATVVRDRVRDAPEPRMPRFSDLFMLLIQMEIAADVDFIRYPIVQRYAGIDEALADCQAYLGKQQDEAKVRAVLDELLVQDGGELVFDGGVSLAGIAHWQPRNS